MISTNNKLSEVTFKCRQHNQKAEAFCKMKYCTERLLCARCNHPHNDIEPIDSLFAFSTILKRDNVREDNAQFVSRFLVSLGEVFRAVKSTEESLLWLHQMLVSVSESSAQLKASVQSLQLLSMQLTTFLSQCKDVKQISDSRQLSELIEWYLTLRSTVAPQNVFDERDREYMQALSQEVNQVAQTLCEKVLSLTQKFNIMKRGGVITQNLPIHPVPRTQTPEQTNQRSHPADNVSDNSVPMVKSEEIQNDSVMEEEKASSGRMEDDTSSIQMTRNKRNPRQTREMKNLMPPEPKDKSESSQKKNAKKKKESTEKLQASSLASNNDKVDESAPKKLFEGNQKEKIEIVERWLANFENSQEKTPEEVEEAKQIRIDLDAAKELVKAARAISGMPENNPIKELKKDITRVFHDLHKSPNNKPPEFYLELILKNLEEKRLELIEEFKHKVKEEDVRSLITKMKESRIDLKIEFSKLIEICLEYQLRWGKLQSELSSFQSKPADFATYQSAMERFCRLKLMTPNAEQTINQFFEVKAAQIPLEYFFVCLQKFDLSNELPLAYSNDTNELDAELIFQRLQEVSIDKAREILAQVTRPTQVSCTFGESFDELTQAVAQAETAQKELEEALKNYETDQNKEAVLAQAEESLQSRLFFSEMVKLKPFNPKIIPKIPALPVKTKKSNPKAEAKAYSVDSDDESSEEFKLSRRSKKVKQEVIPQLAVSTRSTRSRPQVAE